MKPQIVEWARILVKYSLDVQPGEWIMLAGGIPALPLINEIARQILLSEAHYDLVLDSDVINKTCLQEASRFQLEWISPSEKLRFEQMDGIVYVGAVENTRSLSGIDPQKQQWHTMGRNRLIQIRNQRVQEGKLRWVYTEFPCSAFAQDADMSLDDFEEFVYAACYADNKDGVQRCCDVYQRDNFYASLLNGRHHIKVRGPDVDLSLSVEGRSFVNSAGRRNIPDGEIFTGPVENSVNGWVRFGFPAIYAGREVEGVELRFVNGKVSDAHAVKNESFLHKMLAMDAGSEFVGEFAIGTNYQIQRFTRRILFDEKIGGTIHMAIGNGYPETGSLNKSAIHWDFICDMRQDSEILADGEVVYRNGRFLADGGQA
jgi:aminopeptidase